MQGARQTRQHGLHVGAEYGVFQRTTRSLRYIQQVGDGMDDVVLKNFAEGQKRAIEYQQRKPRQIMVFVYVWFKGRQ